MPAFLIALDGIGTLFVVFAVLGLAGIDIGLPALAAIWPFLIVVGIGLMVPMTVWIVRKARTRASGQN